jgi:hypothetical protein
MGVLIAPGVEEYAEDYQEDKADEENEDRGATMMTTPTRGRQGRRMDQDHKNGIPTAAGKITGTGLVDRSNSGSNSNSCEGRYHASTPSLRCE